jgi:hypothetical protein
MNLFAHSPFLLIASIQPDVFCEFLIRHFLLQAFCKAGSMSSQMM